MNLLSQQLPQTKAPDAFLIDRPVYFNDLLAILKSSSHKTSRSTIYRWVRENYLPQPRKLGTVNFWPAHQIWQWANEHGLVLRWPDDSQLPASVHRISH